MPTLGGNSHKMEGKEAATWAREEMAKNTQTAGLFEPTTLRSSQRTCLTRAATAVSSRARGRLLKLIPANFKLCRKILFLVPRLLHRLNKMPIIKQFSYPSLIQGMSSRGSTRSRSTPPSTRAFCFLSKSSSLREHTISQARSRASRIITGPRLPFLAPTLRKVLGGMQHLASTTCPGRSSRANSLWRTSRLKGVPSSRNLKARRLFSCSSCLSSTACSRLCSNKLQPAKQASRGTSSISTTNSRRSRGTLPRIKPRNLSH